jgi:hypothetical protein
VHLTHRSFWPVVASCCLLLRALPAQAEPPPPKVLPVAGEVFEVAGRPAFLIRPPAPRRPTEPGARKRVPWVWYAPTLPGLPAAEERWMFERFVAAGVAIAGVDVGESYGSPDGRAVYAALHQELVGRRGLAKRAALLARSRGGLMLYPSPRPRHARPLRRSLVEALYRAHEHAAHQRARHRVIRRQCQHPIRQRQHPSPHRHFGNGIVAFGPFVDTPGTPNFLPTSVGFLQSTNGGVYAWHDYNATEVGSGAVWSHYAGNTLCVTFLGIESYPLGVVNPSTLQFQFDLTTGAIVFVDVDGNPSSPFGSRSGRRGFRNRDSRDRESRRRAVVARRHHDNGPRRQLAAAGERPARGDGVRPHGDRVLRCRPERPRVHWHARLRPACVARHPRPVRGACGNPVLLVEHRDPGERTARFSDLHDDGRGPDPATNALGLITSNGIRGLVNGF